MDDTTATPATTTEAKTLNISQAISDLDIIIHSLMDDDNPIGDKGALVDDLASIQTSLQAVLPLTSN